MGATDLGHRVAQDQLSGDGDTGFLAYAMFPYHSTRRDNSSF